MKKDTEKLRFFGIPKVFPFMMRYKKLIAVMMSFGLLGSCADILIPLYQRYALNHYVAEKTLDTMVLFIIIYVLTVGIQSLLNYVACRNAMTVEVSVNRDLRQAAFTHLQTLSFSYFNLLYISKNSFTLLRKSSASSYTA